LVVVIGLLLLLSMGCWFSFRLIWLGCRFLSMWKVFVIVSGEWLGSMMLFEFMWIVWVDVVIVVISIVGEELIMFGSEWCLVI